MKRTLLCGWFSVEGGEATAGDLIAMELTREELQAAGCAVDVATNVGFPGGVEWREVDPEDYGQVAVVCGPLHGDRLAELIERFPHARKVAVNVSVVDREFSSRFDIVIPRDGDGETNPDLTLLWRPSPVPVVGVVRSHHQPEYEGALHDRAHDAIRLMLASRPCATVDFDTRVHPSADPFAAHARGPAEVAALAARVDVVVTTRLHGLVLGLAQGTPALAIDPVAQGGKIARQAAVLRWPAVFTSDDLHPEHLAETLSWCLTQDARDRARTAVGAAQERLGNVRARIRAAVATLDGS